MENKKIKFPLSRKIALLVIAFVLLLNSLVIVISYNHYKREMFEDYARFTMDIAAVAASQLNPDKFDMYLETGKKDAEYEQAFEVLCDIQQNGGVEYLYVVKPGLQEVWYILDTDPSEGALPLGYHEPYYAGAFAANSAKMVRGEAVEPMVSNEEFGWLMSVYYPMRTSEGSPAGYVGVDILMNDVMEDLHSFALQMVSLMIVLTAALSCALIYISSKTVAEPIRKLSAAAGQLVDSEHARSSIGTDIFKQLTIRSNDEVGALYESLAQMEEDMNTYIRDLLSVTAENERITTELSLATRIQADMMPNIFPPFPERNEFDIFASMKPAREVGGDFYDFFLVDNDHLCMVMADVSGKGVPAALFMMASKIVLASYAMMGLSASEILNKANQALCANNQEEMFVTVWIGILEISTGKLTAANAGHEYPTLRHQDGKFELVKDRHGFVIGGMAVARYQAYELQLEPGSKLFVYTDGVPEATNGEGRMFGTERMLTALNEDPGASPDQILKNVNSAVSAFVDKAEQFDDLTMLCLDYKGPGKQDSKSKNKREKTENDFSRKD